MTLPLHCKVLGSLLMFTEWPGRTQNVGSVSILLLSHLIFCGGWEDGTGCS